MRNAIDRIAPAVCLSSLMKASSLFGHIAELLDTFRPSQAPADAVVRDFFAKRHYLGSRDRRFIAEVFYGVLRHFKRLRHRSARTLHTLGISPPSSQPSLMFAAAHELLINRVSPTVLRDHIAGLWLALVPEVDCLSFCEKFTQVDESPDDDPAERISIRHSMPAFVVRQWLHRYGERETEELCRTLNEPAPVTMRVNTLKTRIRKCREILQSEGLPVRPTLLSPVGLIADHRFAAQTHQSFRDGLFEMQDEGSQILSMLVDPQPGDTVVDACAGGGGKSLHMAALMQNRGVLIAMDVDGRRLKNTSLRAERAGVTVLQVRHIAGEDAQLSDLTGRADRVLVDAPCTGVGTIRRNPGLKMRISEALVRSLVLTQRTLLERYASLVRPGGRLIYSTCSLLREENEDVVTWFLSSHPEFAFVPPPPVPGIEADPMMVTLFPHRVNTDGFFAAIMTRSETH
jgi:16S rRNA (cytosine967-C5)-methyltransferase